MALFNSFAFIFASCVFLGAPILSLQAEQQRIVVSQENENSTDNSTCVREKTIPCQTLNFALRFVENDTLVYLESGRYSYNLTEHFSFNNKSFIGFEGDQKSSLVWIDCHLNGSLSFQNSDKIKFKGIALRGCGGKHNSTVGVEFKNHFHIPFLSALFFVYCKDVIIENCAVVQSPGIGANFYDVGGEVVISHSTFENNGPTENAPSPQNIAIAGGGVYVEFTLRGGLYPYNRDHWQLAEFDSNSTYIFHNCTFKNNSAPKQNSTTIHIDTPRGDDHFPFGRGGGLSVFVRGAAKNNLLNISLCNFEDNYALWGGGLFVEYHGETQNNTVHVVTCLLRNNNAHFAGGAIRTGSEARSDTLQLLANQFIHENCTFENNFAIFGGAVSHHAVLSFLKDPTGKAHHVRYINCQWINNQATMGAAIGLASPPSTNGLGDTSGRGPLLTYRVDLEDCNISGNAIVLSEDEKVIGQGTIYSYSVPVIFRGVVNIENNTNTAMVIENAVLRVFGNVIFRNNRGGQGGALGLYGTSVIMLMPGSRLRFTNNTASEQGGALYAKDPGPPVMAFDTTELRTRPCIIDYNDSRSVDHVSQWQTEVVFVGNKVVTAGGGNSVFSSTLSGCRQVGQPRINNKSLEWDNVMHYNDSATSNGPQIATDAIQINLNESEWHVSPSEEFTPFVKLIDEKNHSVMGIINLTLVDGHVKLGSASNLFLIQSNHIHIDNLYLLGKEEKEFRVSINTVAGRVVRKHSGKISLKRCPPGFEQRSHLKTCSCLKGEPGIANCTADAKNVFLRRGYWGGMVGDKKFVTYPCPQHHCNKYVSKNSTFKFDSGTICTVGRNGSSVLCGACNETYSVLLGSEKCKACSNTTLGLLLVFFILTTLLVLLVLRIEVNIFTTYLNTWLYSFQIILYLVHEGQSLDPFISFVIGLANWRLSNVGVCLFNGMNNLQKLGINYLLPAFVLLLLFVLARIARCRPSCYINRNVSRAFCTLLVLCYTNVTRISWDILHYVPLNGKWVLYDDGNIEFKDWKTHLPYTLLALVWILGFVLFLPLVLLFTPWFTRWIPFLKNFRLFFDTFQQCFRDEYRWFAAYYFICRLFILSFALFVPFGPLKRSLLEVSCIFIVVVCVYLRPYRIGENEDYSWLNTLDAILLTNLCLVVTFSSNIVNDTTQSIRDGLTTTVNVLAYVPLVYLVILVGYRVWNYCCPKNFNDFDEIPENPSTTENVRHAQPI